MEVGQKTGKTLGAFIQWISGGLRGIDTGIFNQNNKGSLEKKGNWKWRAGGWVFYLMFFLGYYSCRIRHF